VSANVVVSVVVEVEFELTQVEALKVVDVVTVVDKLEVVWRM
jgi:hypothetical protein